MTYLKKFVVPILVFLVVVSNASSSAANGGESQVPSQLVGFSQAIPPFATAKDGDITRGVNYASGSAGIRDESGNKLGTHVSLNKQLENHRNIISRLANIMGNQTDCLLNKCLYTVGMGSNDYINNYFLPQSPARTLFSPDQYAAELIDQYSQQIKSLHDAGARKMALFGLGLIGCTPFEMASSGNNGSCADNINSAAQLFNGRLVSLVDELNKELADAKVTYINMTGITTGGDPSRIGIKVVNAGCCPINNVGQCVPNSIPCPNRNEYAFFDGFHPTEIVNKVSAARCYKADSPSDAYPFDISHLVQG
ncbi:hypothetical protein Tsubulata_005389 [Turnera subulata]|uniref:SGNH hydrolase-type esterase domain-containing protein n=1 Tax=Turnera subulata TaxID=218843 RepID=A0A9Q0G657_9ROSI|nr:hypothetical protein Tsubulata_005389 [Turnera subulata]